jgi:MoaA/NifB/PqqE/SkfB family radical SAM enzyme
MLERFNPQLKLALNPRFGKFVAGEKVYPINIEVSPSNVCDAICDWCFYKGTHTKPKEGAYMEDGMLVRLLHEMKELDVKAISWTGGGEPTLHPMFPQAVELAHELGLKQGMFTNARSPRGIRYTPEHFDWIRVSNTDEDWNKDNLKELRARTKILGMAVNYDGNDEVVRHAEEVGEEIGVDYIQIRQALNLRGLVTTRLPPALTSKKAFLTTYKFDDSSNPHGYSACYGFNFVPFIWNDGSVDVCGYMKKVPGYSLGSLKEKSLRQIIDEAPRSVPVRDICQVCCKNHEINKATNTALALEDKDFV